MATFIGPTVGRAWPNAGRLFSRVPIARGICVIKINGHYVQREFPWAGDLVGLTDGVDYFLGGHTYTNVDTTTAAALTADGFGTYLS